MYTLLLYKLCQHQLFTYHEATMCLARQSSVFLTKLPKRVGSELEKDCKQNTYAVIFENFSKPGGILYGFGYQKYSTNERNLAT